jgi:hypothetical protein
MEMVGDFLNNILVECNFLSCLLSLKECDIIPKQVLLESDVNSVIIVIDNLDGSLESSC